MAASAERTQVCNASAEACFDVMADLEAYPSWQSAVRSVRVRERDGNGRPAVAEFVTDAKIRDVRYVLAYHYDRPRRIWWDYVEGDAKTVNGEIRFDALDAGRTSVTYRLEVDAGGRLVPGRIKQQLAEQAVESSLRKLGERAAG